MSNINKGKLAVVPLPATPAEWVLKSGLQKTLNDDILAIHERIINDQKLSKKYLEALAPVSDDQSKDGWLGFEDVTAVTMIKEYAIANSYPRVSSAQGVAIKKALNTVLRKYGMSRAQRRYMVDGEIVPPPSADHEE